jgi:hypothetical protein
VEEAKSGQNSGIHLTKLQTHKLAEKPRQHPKSVLNAYRRL